MTSSIPISLYDFEQKNMAFLVDPFTASSQLNGVAELKHLTCMYHRKQMHSNQKWP